MKKNTIDLIFKLVGIISEERDKGRGEKILAKNILKHFESDISVKCFNDRWNSFKDRRRELLEVNLKQFKLSTLILIKHSLIGETKNSCKIKKNKDIVIYHNKLFLQGCNANLGMI